MTLTASDVASLSRSLHCWEIAEYVFAGLVTVACAGEYAAEFTDWFTCGIKERKDALAKRSTLVLVAALALELICLVKTNTISGALIGSLSDKAENADRKAQSAIDKSSLADAKADHANTEADDVTTQAQVLTQYLAVVAKIVNPRTIDFKKLSELMKGQPKASLEIWFDHGDGESEIFADQLSAAFGNPEHGLGWDTTVKAFAEVTDPALQIIRQDSGMSGLAYAARVVPQDRNAPLQVLVNAVDASVRGRIGVTPLVTDPWLPDNHFVIAVGHHVVNLPTLNPPKAKKQR